MGEADGTERLDYAGELRGAFDPASGRFTVPGDWEGMPGAAFGGFLAAAVLVAAAGRTTQPRPLSLFCRYYRPAPVGRALHLALEVERRGRSLDTIAARLVDGERLLSTCSVAFGSEGTAPLASQAVAGMAPLRSPRPVWQHVEETGRAAPQMMRRVGFRSESEAPPEEAAAGWHLRAEWPAPPAACGDPAVRAAAAVMAIDAFVAPATLRANACDLDREWPVMVPSLDLTGWFYAPEDRYVGDWLSVRTSVPVSRAGYAVGRSQVWAGPLLVAEGMSQVALVPVPRAADA